jgi:hypothetical protein
MRRSVCGDEEGGAGGEVDEAFSLGPKVFYIQ